MSDGPTEALPPRGKSLRILLSKSPQHVESIGPLARSFGYEHPIAFCLQRPPSVRERRLRASSYQPTRDGKRSSGMIHLNVRGGNWSGRRDKNGFAAGSGTLTWYQVEPTIVTGSNIPDARRYAVVISRCTGKMVEGKFEGAVTYVDANGKDCRRPLLMEVSGRQSGTFRQPHNKPRLQFHNRRPAWRRNRRRPERRATSQAT